MAVLPGPTTACTQCIIRVFQGAQEKVKGKIKAVSITELPFQPPEWDLLLTHSFIHSAFNKYYGGLTNVKALF